MNNLMQVNYNDEIVITTKMLAKVYECEETNIKTNFNRNKTRFIEGKHYYKVEGEELKDLRVTNSNLQISSKARVLYLWTKQGASRHCKILDTDRAWQQFDVLEENYFNPKVIPSYQIENPIERAKAWIKEEEERQRLKEVIRLEQTITDSRKVINRIVRTIATSKRYQHHYGIAWFDFYSILNYRLGLNIKKRSRDKYDSFMDTLSDEELRDAEKVARCWAEELHIDVRLALSDYDRSK